MNRKHKFIIILLLNLLFYSCKNSNQEVSENKTAFELVTDSTNINLLKDINSQYKDWHINAIIEIPAGTLEKWELNKSSGQIEWEKVNDIPRVVNYLGYPGNYGFIPQTLLSKEEGGDGDPLDIIVLGPPVKRGSILKSKIIGVLELLDNGEQDDKLIAVSQHSPLYEINDITQLDEINNGITEIIKIWFSNYKGLGKMEAKRYGDKNKANKLVKSAMQNFHLNAGKNGK